jgi:hypothetical protein
MRPLERGHAGRITLRAHPPERGRRPGATAYAGCSSCCCCCLHAVGSLAGAVAGAFYPRGPRAPAGEKSPIPLADDEIAGTTAERPATFPLGPIYWSVTLGAAGLVPLVAFLSTYTIGDSLLWPAIFLPLIQLGASLLSALAIAAYPAARRDRRTWRRLGWMTLGSVLGCVAGAVFMVSLVVTGVICN